MSSKRTGFKLPTREAQDVQGWVEEGAAPVEPVATPKAPGKAVGGKQARLTIDLPQQLHARFKAACAINQTRMVEEVTQLIEEWTQKHS
jgi:hypothetical protein